MTSTVATQHSEYDTTITRLFAQRTGQHRGGRERIRVLLAAIGNPHQHFDTIHITGTNGKTTTARFVSRVLRAHNQRVGTYTSPHLQDVRERIVVDNEAVTPDGLAELLSVLETKRELVSRHCGWQPTFFELITAAAFSFFADQQVNTAVCEVGIGGDEDATNVLDAGISIIGTVANDHPQLGSSLVDKARHKAGIIAHGATVVVGPQPQDVAAVIDQRANQQRARLLRYGREWSVTRSIRTKQGQEFAVRLPNGDLQRIELSSYGRYQAVNAAAATVACQALLGYVDTMVVRAALADVATPGRGEVVERAGKPPVWLDGAHNPAAAQCVAETVRKLAPQSTVTVVLGVMADKDIYGTLAPLVAVADHVVTTSLPFNRAASADSLAKTVATLGKCAIATKDVREALDIASTTNGADDLIVVAGSLYCVGVARDALGLSAVLTGGRPKQ